MKLRIFSLLILIVAFTACRKCYTCTRDEVCYEYYYDDGATHYSSGVHCIDDFISKQEYEFNKDLDHDDMQSDASWVGATLQENLTNQGTTEKDLCGKSTGMSGMDLQDDVDQAELEGYDCVGK
jgi:hypothetical protein